MVRKGESAMKIAKRLLKLFGIVCLVGFVFNGCSIESKKTAKKESETSFLVDGVKTTFEKGSDIIGGILKDIDHEFLGVFDEDDTSLTEATLVRVVDGDTLVVKVDGEEAKVRLIGVDTPESVASEAYLALTGKKNTEEGVKASDYTKELLKDIKTLWLEKDTSDTDKYGRLLRYVWLERPTDTSDINEIAGKMLNAVLIKNGVAEIATYKPDTAHKADFETIYAMSHEDGYED